MPKTNWLTGLQCPHCKNDKELDVVATGWVRMTPTEFYWAPVDPKKGYDDGHDESSQMRCPKCGYSGLVKKFKI